jgi:hypothetical protein
VGAIHLLGDDAIDAAAGEVTVAYRRALEKAATAFTEFREYLKVLHESAENEAAGCGEETLALHLLHAHCLKQSAGEIAAYAREELHKASAALEERCAGFGSGDPASLLESLCTMHPTVADYYGSYQKTWDKMRALAVSNELLTWPDFPIRYVPQPSWARRAAPHLYFLYYRSPAASHRPAVHDYLVTPIESSMPAEEQLARLRSNNDSAIKLNHVVHHAGIGHHIQNWHAFQAESQVGRIAAIDGASRIAMHCGGTMAEGWACYATDLVAEYGGLSPLEELAELHTRVRMCSRALVDISFHGGEMTFEQAVGFYEQVAGMSHTAAVYETTRNSMYPGSALIYVAGMDAIHELRRDLEAHAGNDFNLCEFHDRFLSYGSIPVALIAESMREAQNQGS